VISTVLVDVACKVPHNVTNVACFVNCSSNLSRGVNSAWKNEGRRRMYSHTVVNELHLN
jgi:hypothetical protein